MAAVAVSSASGLLAMLNEHHPILKLHALTNLNRLVDNFWPEISTSVPTIESLYEDEAFDQRQLAALVVSKVFYYLGELNDSLSYALGAGSLFNVSEDSDYARLCKSYNKRVDCAFEVEALEGIHKDPHSVMKEILTKDNGDPPCPHCYHSLHKFWCAQTVPTCGIYDKVVDEILPMISSVALKKATPVAAVQLAIPRMLQTASLGLPCRRMCNAITETCGCGEPVTFGQVMTSIQASNSHGLNTSMSSSTAKLLFQNIWDKQVCDLFAEDTVPGFGGECDVPAEEPKCSWCSKSNHPRNIHSQIVAQIAQTISGIMQGGLQTILSEAGGVTHKGSLDTWKWNQDKGSDKSENRRHTAVTVVLVLLLTIAVACLVTAIIVYRARQRPSQYVDLNSMGYTPPFL